MSTTTSLRATSLPRLLAGAAASGAVGLAEHHALHGPPHAPPDLIDRCERAGLRGRGGALFPTAIKLRSVAAGRGPRVVVVNAAEGEPMSAKDRALLEHVPHLVLDGAAAAAAAVGADTVVVALTHSAVHARAAVLHALAERGDTRTRVAAVPDGLLTGEETALIAALESRPAKPTVAPPRPSDRGLRRRPTLVQNAETVAHLALIARHGPRWFRALGRHGHPGSALVSLGGSVRAPGVHEIALGASLGEVLERTGGVTEPLRAVLLGGYHGRWVDAARVGSERLDEGAGAGVVVALPRSACPVAEVSQVMTWLAHQTAGQCGPCVHGLAAIAGALVALREGRIDHDGLRRLRRWGGDITRRGACHHPDGAARFLVSALDVFEAELELHRRFGPCEGCDRPAVLHTPALAVAA